MYTHTSINFPALSSKRSEKMIPNANSWLPDLSSKYHPSLIESRFLGFSRCLGERACSRAEAGKYTISLEHLVLYSKEMFKK